MNDDGKVLFRLKRKKREKHELSWKYGNKLMKLSLHELNKKNTNYIISDNTMKNVPVFLVNQSK